MGLVRIIGNAGSRGLNANANGGVPTDGSMGQTVSADNMAIDERNVRAVAQGGAGGRGGNGTARVAGADGGEGGDASARAEAQSATLRTLTAQADATGGRGGAGGARGGDGGDGGDATGATASAISGRDDDQSQVTAQATGTGGDGGTGNGAGGQGGDGGTATNVTARAELGGIGIEGEGALAIAIATGGNGGAGINGANGGRGGDAQLNSAAQAVTDGGRSVRDQQAIGGNGGDSDTGRAGNGGDARSNLFFDDRTSVTQSSEANAFVTARGGNGGRQTFDGIGGDGGMALTSMALTAGATYSITYAYGGDGGDGAIGGGRGGAAGGTAFGDIRPGAIDLVVAKVVAVEAYAGAGGDSLGDGNGGVGGEALVTTAQVNSASLYLATAAAVSRAGDGGAGSGVGFSGANGLDSGQVFAFASGSGGGDVRAFTEARAGDGGDGLNGANAGNGGHAWNAESVVATNISAGVNLDMNAYGGAGGDARGGGNGGIGGDATIRLDRDLQATAIDATYLQARTIATAGAGGSASGPGAAAGRGGDALVEGNARSHNTGGFTISAEGGAGGAAIDGATVADGGAAAGTSTSVATDFSLAWVLLYGGAGGDSIASGVAGSGGTVSGTATATGDDFAEALIEAYAGDGGQASGAGSRGGDGAAVGVLRAQGSGIEWGAANVRAEAGSGGTGLAGADGGRGAAVHLADVVAATSAGGTVALTQSAYAGSGGDSTGGQAGAGGDASSRVTYLDDVTNGINAGLIVRLEAQGGNGGTQFDEGGTATGGAAGNGTAELNVSGGSLDVFASAIAGRGVVQSGIAEATARVDGASGIAGASALAGLTNGPVSVAGRAILTVDGEAIVVARAQAGNAEALVLDQPADAFAIINAGIGDGALSAILTDNDAVRAAFGMDVEAASTALLGGAKSGGEGLQTITNTMAVTIAMGQLDGVGESMIGLVDGEVLGAGFETLQLDISVDGVSLYTRMFADEAEAEAFFDDAAINLGDLSGYMNGFGDVTFDVALTTVSSTIGGGFAAELIFGDIGDLGIELPAIGPWSDQVAMPAGFFA